MITDEDIDLYHAGLKEIYSRALDDISFFLDKAIRESPDEISRIYTASRLSKRVKSSESLVRKIRRDNIETVDTIPETVEDILGIRISTPNKFQANKLFDWFQEKKDAWFCNLFGEPKFVPYTTEHRNKYSLRTGYQAYHITFVVDRGYAPFTPERRWPCELQIMAQVWEFWANYSRRYFYATSGPEVTQLLPYNTAISKILDSADDLMMVTADLLLSSEQETAHHNDQKQDNRHASVTAATNEEEYITFDRMKTWLEENVTNLIHETAKVPNNVFIAKTANELNIYNISLGKLADILQDEKIVLRYKKLLDISSIPFLPIYQQILCMILLYLDRDIKVVLDRVNAELLPLGLRLLPPPAGTWP
jgi:ppGpp synthetase/RelA/SpoT-type nucleotidyltranferase